jgi:hypothetical protein
MTVPIYTSDTRRERNGLFLSHAMTLCRDHEVLRKMALTESHQPYIGGLKNMKKPCQMPNNSCVEIRSSQNLDAKACAHLDQNELMKQRFPPHVGHRDAGHDDKRPDHESLRP